MGDRQVPFCWLRFLYTCCVTAMAGCGVADSGDHGCGVTDSGDHGCGVAVR